jgi:ABC-type Fe3+-siderophore transport system permease subunit
VAELGGSRAARDAEATSVFLGGVKNMLETIAIILIVLWLLGIVSGYTMGNFIYVLLVIAIVMLLVRLVSGRRVV